MIRHYSVVLLIALLPVAIAAGGEYKEDCKAKVLPPHTSKQDVTRAIDEVAEWYAKEIDAKIDAKKAAQMLYELGQAETRMGTLACTYRQDSGSRGWAQYTATGLFNDVKSALEKDPGRASAIKTRWGFDPTRITIESFTNPSGNSDIISAVFAMEYMLRDVGRRYLDYGSYKRTGRLVWVELDDYIFNKEYGTRAKWWANNWNREPYVEKRNLKLDTEEKALAYYKDKTTAEDANKVVWVYAGTHSGDGDDVFKEGQPDIKSVAIPRIESITSLKVEICPYVPPEGGCVWVKYCDEKYTKPKAEELVENIKKASSWGGGAMGIWSSNVVTEPKSPSGFPNVNGQEIKCPTVSEINIWYGGCKILPACAGVKAPVATGCAPDDAHKNKVKCTKDTEGLCKTDLASLNVKCCSGQPGNFECYTQLPAKSAEGDCEGRLEGDWNSVSCTDRSNEQQCRERARKTHPLAKNICCMNDGKRWWCFTDDKIIPTCNDNQRKGQSFRCESKGLCTAQARNVDKSIVCCDGKEGGWTCYSQSAKEAEKVRKAEKEASRTKAATKKDSLFSLPYGYPGFGFSGFGGSNYRYPYPTPQGSTEIQTPVTTAGTVTTTAPVVATNANLASGAQVSQPTVIESGSQGDFVYGSDLQTDIPFTLPRGTTVAAGSVINGDYYESEETLTEDMPVEPGSIIRQGTEITATGPAAPEGLGFDIVIPPQTVLRPGTRLAGTTVFQPATTFYGGNTFQPGSIISNNMLGSASFTLSVTDAVTGQPLDGVSIERFTGNYNFDELGWTRGGSLPIEIDSADLFVLKAEKEGYEPLRVVYKTDDIPEQFQSIDAVGVSDGSKHTLQMIPLPSG